MQRRHNHTNNNNGQQHHHHHQQQQQPNNKKEGEDKAPMPPPSSSNRHQEEHVSSSLALAPNHHLLPRSNRVSLSSYCWTRVLILPIIVALLLGLIIRQRRDNYHGDDRLDIFSQCRNPHHATTGVVLMDGEEDIGVADSSSTMQRPCVYFRPTLYFSSDDPSQPGYKYKQLIEETINNSENLDMKFTMWGKYVSNFDDSDETSRPNEFLVRQGITSVSTIMMPKVASRSIDALFLDKLSVPLVPPSNKKLVDPNTKRTTVNFINRLSSFGPRVGIATPSYWKQLAQRQQQQQQQRQNQNQLHGSQKDIVFCLVRNPVTRFLSSLAQTLSVPMQRKCEQCKNVLQPCIDVVPSSSYQQLVQCVIDTMMKRKRRKGSSTHSSDSYYYYDVHVVPQAVFLVGSFRRQQQQYYDIELAVFSMDHNNGLDALMHAFGGGSGSGSASASINNNNRHKNKRNDMEFSTEIMEKFGIELHDPQKARMALDDDMVHDICKLYEVDVTMMRYLGFPVEECNI